VLVAGESKRWPDPFRVADLPQSVRHAREAGALPRIFISAGVRPGEKSVKQIINPALPESMLPIMRLMTAFMILITGSGCGVASQPESGKAVAAFEVPLLTDSDREQFLLVLRAAAEPEGMHVDAMGKGELQADAAVGPHFRHTLRAAVWVGSKDTDAVAVAMDQSDRLGEVWLMFLRGEDPLSAGRFREQAMTKVMRHWPNTLTLPIMPSGTIPLYQDLIRQGNGYIINPSAASRYELGSQRAPHQKQ
jgi:hypothetical protein